MFHLLPETTYMTDNEFMVARNLGTLPDRLLFDKSLVGKHFKGYFSFQLCLPNR